jgi:hypothetical protein
MDAMVCAVTGLSPEALATVKFEAAYDYLEHVIGTDAYGLQNLPLTAVFWGHWRTLWYRIDQQIMLGDVQYPPVFSALHMPDDPRREYLRLHNARLSGYYLNSTLIEEAFHVEVIKKLKTNSNTI